LIYENYLLSNQLLSSIAATAEQTTSSKNDDLKITNVMLKALGKVQKSYLNSAIYEIKEKYQTLEMYIFNELGFNENDIKKLKKLYSN
jgi:protein tyrosine/serine phosphatase